MLDQIFQSWGSFKSAFLIGKEVKDVEVARHVALWEEVKHCAQHTVLCPSHWIAMVATQVAQAIIIGKALWCEVLLCVALFCNMLLSATMCFNTGSRCETEVLHCFAMCCFVLQCVSTQAMAVASRNRQSIVLRAASVSPPYLPFVTAPSLFYQL